MNGQHKCKSAATIKMNNTRVKEMKIFAVARTEFDLYVVVSWNSGEVQPEFSRCSQRIDEIFHPFFCGIRAQEKAEQFRDRCSENHGKMYKKYRALLRMTGETVDRDFDHPLSFVEATKELSIKKSHLIDFFLLNELVDKETTKPTYRLFPADEMRMIM